MTLTLDVTISGSNSNSYVDVAYCDDYWLNHYNLTRSNQWSALEPNQKIVALIQACNVIERYKYTVHCWPKESNFQSVYDRGSGLIVQFIYDDRPTRAVYQQKLQFPRNVDYMDNGIYVIPEPVKLAQCEQAAYILSFDESAIATGLQGVTQDITQVDVIRTSQNLTTGGTVLAPMALELLSPYFYRSAGFKRA